MNFTHRKILFTIFFKSFIHFLGNKYLLEKEKKQKLIHFILFLRPNNQNCSARFLWETPGRTQAATWAWADKATQPRTPAWAASWPNQSRPLIQIQWPLSLLSSAQQHRASNRERRRWSGQPWRRRWPPCQRARSPASERTAVERPGRGASLAEARRATPPARPSFPRAPA